MHLHLSAALALALALGFGPAVARAETHFTYYDCTASHDPTSWITDRYLIAADPASDQAAVMDAVINSFNHGKPVTGKATMKTDTTLAVTWSVFVRDSAGANVKLLLKAVIYPKTGQFLIDGQFPGYTNTFTGRGTCQTRTK